MSTINTEHNPVIPTAPSRNAGIFNHAIKALIEHAERYVLPHPQTINVYSHPAGADGGQMEVRVTFGTADLEAWLLTVYPPLDESIERRVNQDTRKAYWSCQYQVRLPDTGVRLTFAGIRHFPLSLIDGVKAGA